MGSLDDNLVGSGRELDILPDEGSISVGLLAAHKLAVDI